MILPERHDRTPSPRIAIVHDWLVVSAGGESVLRDLLVAFPEARVFSLIEKLTETDRADLGLGVVHTSVLQHVPGIAQRYRQFLPVMPLAMRSLDVSDFDIVISVSHAVAKGIRTHDRQLHLCYCLSPMRYAWDLREQYLQESGLNGTARGRVARLLLNRLQRWDAKNSKDVDEFLTLSNYIRERIQRAYQRDAAVIYPPVDTDFFTPSGEARGEYYITASRFVPYKRIDMIAEAFADLPDRRLVIVGTGPDDAKIRALAGPNVESLGYQSRTALRRLLQGARAFVFAADEDFGIAPVEAQACGIPVIAFGRGGATETVRGLDAAEPTGLLYGEQSAEGLAEAIRTFESASGQGRFSTDACRRNAERFSRERFRREFRRALEAAWGRHVELMGPGGFEPPHFGL